MIDGNQCGHDDSCRDCKWYYRVDSHTGFCTQPEKQLKEPVHYFHGVVPVPYSLVQSNSVCELYEDKV
jgi:hypothetical protein